MRNLISAITLATCLSALPQFSAGAADLRKLVTEEFMVAAGDPGIQLYVRNKHPADMARVPEGRILLYVHGATQPSEVTFDLALAGVSWMEAIAAAGWDVWLMDVRGYGRSTRAAALAEAGATQAPVVRTETKVRDLAAVVDFIRARRGAQRISLLGWSWGTIVAAAYAAAHGDRVGSLVLHAPVWCDGPCAFDAGHVAGLAAAHAAGGASAAVVETAAAGARKRFQSGAPADKAAALMPADWFAAWSAALLATDPVGAAQAPPVVRIPAGVREDLRDYWDAGKAFYDPAAIAAPTLIVVGEWDAVTPPEGARGLYDALVNSPGRWLVEIAEGTHIVMLERERTALFREVQRFLEEVSPAR
jgi:pimeloyl-ACP methyl ester carboxylesterase